MKLFYLDEAGNTGGKVDPDQPLHIIGALIVDGDVARHMELRLIEIADQYFGRNATNDDFEFKGSDIKSGDGYCKGIAPAVRIQLVKDLIAVLGQFDAKFMYAGIDKEKQPSSRYPHELAFQFISERAQDLLSGEDGYGLIVADQGSGLDAYLINRMHHYKRHNTGWGWRPTQINNIVGAIHYVDSCDDWLVQLSDVMTYVSTRYRKLHRTWIDSWPAHNTPLVDWIKPQHIAVRTDVELYELLSPHISISKIYP